MATSKMFVHYKGTVDQFKALSNLSDYANKIVFIKGGDDGKGSAIYTHGEYYTSAHDVEALVASLNIVKGVMVNGDSSTLKVASGHNGVINFTNGDETVAVSADGPGIKISVSEVFRNRVSAVETLAGNTSTALGAKTDTKDAEGSAFARIAQLKADVEAMGGTSGSIASQIETAINDLDVAVSTGDYVKTIKQVDGKIEATTGTFNFDEKGTASNLIKGLNGTPEGTGSNGIKVTVTQTEGAVTAVAVDDSAVYKKADAETMAQNKVDALASGAVKANTDAIAKLNGNNTVEGSVAKQIKDAIEAFAGTVDGDTAIENVTELLKYVAGVDGSKDLASAIAQIAENKGKIETLNGNESTAGSVAKVVKDASDSIKTEVQGIIEENERVTAEAYTNLDTRMIALESKNATIDSALQSADITTGSANGTIAVKGSDVVVKGLGSAAFTDAGAYATAEQGSKADSALQEIEAVGGDYITLTDSDKSANKQTVTASVAVKAVASATAAKQGLADSYDVNQEIAGAKSYADALFAWEEL